MEPAAALEHADTENDQRARVLAEVAKLDERSKSILQSRWLCEKKKTLRELAEEYGVTAERIRQIEQQALKRLKLRLAI